MSACAARETECIANTRSKTRCKRSIITIFLFPNFPIIRFRLTFNPHPIRRYLASTRRASKVTLFFPINYHVDYGSPLVPAFLSDIQPCLYCAHTAIHRLTGCRTISDNLESPKLRLVLLVANDLIFRPP